MNAVQQWLNNPDSYTEGLKLYALQPAHNKNLHRSLSRKESAVNFQKLKYELSKQSKAKVKPVKIRTKIVQKEPTVAEVVTANLLVKEKKQAIYFHNLPEALQPTLLEANILFKKLCLLKVQLNNMPENAIEECNAIEMEEHRIKNQQCWDKIDYWQKHKLLPPTPKNEYEDFTPAQLLRKEQNMFSAISRLNSRIKTNKTKLAKEDSIPEITKLKRAIAKAEANVLSKQDDLIKIKDLINGK